MRVFYQRESDSIRFPDFDIKIDLLSVKSGAIKLGILAPDHVAIATENTNNQTISPVPSQSVDEQSKNIPADAIHGLRSVVSTAQRLLEKAEPEMAARVLCDAIRQLDQ